MTKCLIDNITNLILSEQAHLLNFYGELNKDEAQFLECDIKKIDLLNLTHNNIYNTKNQNEILPPSNDIIDGYGFSSKDELKMYFDFGLELISNGYIGVVILAGGQGILFSQVLK